MLDLPKGTLTAGADADVTVFDPDEEWVVDAAASPSQSRNTPFAGWTLKGRAVLTVVGGKIVWQESAIAA